MNDKGWDRNADRQFQFAQDPKRYSGLVSSTMGLASNALLSEHSPYSHPQIPVSFDASSRDMNVVRNRGIF